MNYDLSLSPPIRSLKLVEEMRAREAQPEIQEVVDLLELDPVTTAHLLRQANAPNRALSQHISTLDRAVAMLGFDAVANTVFVESQTDKPRELGSSIGELAFAYVVKTSVLSSLIANALAHFLKMEQHGTVRTAALVHQLGRMAFLSADPGTYLPLWKETVTPDDQSVALPPGIGREIAHLRTDYTRYGEELAKKWKLPPNLAESARYHPDPERTDEGDRSVILAVALSHFAARTMYELDKDLERDQSGERIAKATSDVARTFDVTQQQIEQFLEEAKQSLFETADEIEL